MWETRAQLKCLLLMGMTLLSAVQPAFVWASVRLCVFSVVAIMNILSDFHLSSTEFDALQFPLFSPFNATTKGLFVSSVANTAAPLRLELDPINAMLCDSDTGGATAEDPLTLSGLLCIQNGETNEGNLDIYIFFCIAHISCYYIS